MQKIASKIQEKIFLTTNFNFDEIALELFHFQYTYNPIYKQFVDHLKINVKNVNEIVEASKDIFKIQPKVANLSSPKEAQSNPCAFGSFSIIYNGEIISHHPISKTRFVNIMNSILN